MAQSPRITTLLAWCVSARVWIDPRIQIVDDGQDGNSCGISVCSKYSHIDPFTTLVTIPKTAVLSVRSSSLAGLIPDAAPCGHGALLALSLALYGELSKGSDSYWFGYLQSLPPRPVKIALFWGANPSPEPHHHARLSDADGNLAQKWAVGTEIEREQRGEDGVHLLEDIRKYYFSVVRPLLLSLPDRRSGGKGTCTMEGFLHAYSLVSSRAFLVDAYHGLAMVPIADAFNHAQDNHVHLESDYDVCVVCGSLGQCSHDLEDAATPDESASPPRVEMGLDVGTNTEEAGSDNTCDMVANLYIPPDTQIFNTYGEQLTNAQLLVRYGFTLEDGNDNDVVSWDWEELVLAQAAEEADGLPVGGNSVEELFDAVVMSWSREDVRWRTSELVYQPRDTFPGGGETAATRRPPSGPGSHRRHHASINSDAKVSHQLWVYCALHSLHRAMARRSIDVLGGGSGVPGAQTVDTTLRLLCQLADRQVEIENREETEETDEEMEGGEDADGRNCPSDGDETSIQANPDGGSGTQDEGRARYGHPPRHDSHANPCWKGRDGGNASYPGSQPLSQVWQASVRNRGDLGGRRIETVVGDDETTNMLDEVLEEMVRTIVSLCKRKMAQMGREPEMSMKALGDTLDGLEGWMAETRKALVEVVGERSLLASCVAGWESVGRRTRLEQ